MHLTASLKYELRLPNLSLEITVSKTPTSLAQFILIYMDFTSPVHRNHFSPRGSSPKSFKNRPVKFTTHKKSLRININSPLTYFTIFVVYQK